MAAALEYLPRVAGAYASVTPGVVVRQVNFDGSGDTFVLAATPPVNTPPSTDEAASSKTRKGKE